MAEADVPCAFKNLSLKWPWHILQSLRKLLACGAQEHRGHETVPVTLTRSTTLIFVDMNTLWRQVIKVSESEQSNIHTIDFLVSNLALSFEMIQPIIFVHDIFSVNKRSNVTNKFWYRKASCLDHTTWICNLVIEGHMTKVVLVFENYWSHMHGIQIQNLCINIWCRSWLQERNG